MIEFLHHQDQSDLFPFTLLRDTEDLFVGALTNRQRWDFAAELFGFRDLPHLPAHKIPLFPFWEKVKNIGIEQALEESAHLIPIHRNWDLIQHNETILRSDIDLLKRINTFQPLPKHVQVTGAKEEIYIEEGVTLEQVILNTTSGPIYISKQALIMDGTCLRGPLYIGPGTVVKMGATIYSGTSLGTKVIAGGEIKNSIICSYSNKAHHGYLGDSIIGEWCNLGAGTTVSNIKNTASEVMLWNMNQEKFEAAGKKCGTMMGDFSRTAIQSVLNTGTVIGICTNLVPTSTRIPKYVPSFTWLQDEIETYRLEKAFTDIENWMQFKGWILSVDVKEKLTTIFNKTSL